MKGLVLLCAVLVVLAGLLAGSYFAVPALVSAYGPRLVEDLGFEMDEVEVGRPTFTAVEMPLLRLRGQGYSIVARGGHIRYRLLDLLDGQLEAVSFATFELTVVEEDPAGAPDGDLEALASEPVDPAAVLAAIPIAGVEIRELTLVVPEMGFRGVGQVTLRDGAVEFAMSGVEPPEAEPITLAGTLADNGAVSVRFDQRGAVSGTFLDVNSVLTERGVELDARVDLSGYALALVGNLAGLPAGDGRLQGAVESTLPWPVPDTIAETLVVDATFQVDWADAAGVVRLAGVRGSARLDSGAVHGVFSGGVVQYADEELKAQAMISDGLAFSGSATAVALAEGLEFAVNGSGFNAGGRVAELQLVPGDKPELRVIVDARVSDGDTEIAGRLSAEARYNVNSNDEISGSGELTVAGYGLPLAFQHNLTRQHGRLTSAGRLDVRQPLAKSVLPGWAEPFDFDAGGVSYGLEVEWREDAVTADASLSIESGSAHFEDYRFTGIAGELGAAFNDEVFMLLPSHLEVADADVGFPVTGIEADFAGMEDTVRIALTGTSALYDDYLLQRVAGDLTFKLQDDEYVLIPSAVSAASLDIGLPLTNLQATVSWAGDTVKIDNAGFELLSGRAAVSPFDLDIESLDAAFELAVAEISLAEVLALEGDNIRGSGVIEGTLPVAVRAGQASVSGGRVSAVAPGGTIELAPDFGAMTGQPGLDFAILALTNYAFTSLNASVDYSEDGELKLGVSLQGSNPDVEKGRPIHYNLNVTENILVLLASLRAQQLVTEGVERRVFRQKE